jgi:hypothetical protein
MSGDHNANQKDKSFVDEKLPHGPVEPFFIDIPKLARGAGITISKNIQSQTRFHADMVSLDSLAFAIGERRLDHCLNMLRQAGYNEAADYLQGVG